MPNKRANSDRQKRRRSYLAMQLFGSRLRETGGEECTDTVRVQHEKAQRNERKHGVSFLEACVMIFMLSLLLIRIIPRAR